MTVAYIERSDAYGFLHISSLHFEERRMLFLSIFDAISLMLTFGIFLIALLTYIRSDKK